MIVNLFLVVNYFIVFRLNVVVYYDYAFNQKFPTTARQRIIAIMDVVKQEYLESTFGTKLYVNTLDIKYAQNYNWKYQNWEENYPDR